MALEHQRMMASSCKENVMNTLDLYYPRNRDEFGYKVKAFIEEHGNGVSVDFDTLAPDTRNVLVALTDSKWRIIAFGYMVADARKELPLGDVKSVIIDPNHGQIGNVKDDVLRNLGNIAWDRRQRL